jgi:hypothetical protein
MPLEDPFLIALRSRHLALRRFDLLGDSHFILISCYRPELIHIFTDFLNFISSSLSRKGSSLGML